MDNKGGNIMIRETKPKVKISYEEEIEKEYLEYLEYHYEDMPDEELNRRYKKYYLGER